jgi:hypothetical protein
LILNPNFCAIFALLTKLELGKHRGNTGSNLVSYTHIMTQFFQPDLGQDIDNPFIRDGADKLVRRSYWLDMNDRTLVMVMVNGIGANLTNDEKRAHLADLRREHLIDQVCVQEILPPEK